MSSRRAPADTQARGGVTAADLEAMLQASLRWDSGTLLSYQRLQLAQLLRHARANVPFYRNRLDCVFAADGSIEWNRWQEIPILTKSDLRRSGKQLLARRLPPGHGKAASFETSGSSGIPVKVTTTSLANVMRKALWNRFYALNGVHNTGPHIKFWFTKPGNKRFKERFVQAKSQPNLFYGNRNLSPARQLDVIAETGVQVFSEFATTLLHMAHVNLARRNRVRLNVAIPYGMGLTAAECAAISMSFGATVLCPYSSKEGGLMGFHILPDTRMILNAEAFYPEFLPVPGSADQGLRRMIITPLLNAAQPLIRYDQGDLVEPASSPFPGSALPVLNRIAGRSDDFFLLKGKPVPVVGIQDDTINRLLKASAYQLAQTGRNHVELRYVARRELGPGAKAAITRHLHVKLRQDFAVAYRKLKAIPATPGGKQQRFKREWNP